MSVRPVISRLLGAALLLVSTLASPLVGSIAQQTQAQQSIVVSATVPAALELIVSTGAVAFGSINPGTSADKPDAFTLTVKTNTTPWRVTSWTTSTNLLAGSLTIPVQDNLLYSWQSGPWYSLSSAETVLFSNVEIPTVPTTQPVSLRLRVPNNASPGDYSVTMMVHLQ